MNLYSKTMTPDVNGVVASIERKAAEDRNVIANATHLIRTLERIIKSDGPADFLGTADGISFLHSVHSMTGCNALYSLAEDCEAEFAADLARERAVLRSVGSEPA